MPVVSVHGTRGPRDADREDGETVERWPLGTERAGAPIRCSDDARDAAPNGLRPAADRTVSAVTLDDVDVAALGSRASSTSSSTASSSTARSHARLTDSIETAYREGRRGGVGGRSCPASHRSRRARSWHLFSERFECRTLRHPLRGPAASAVLVQQPVRRLPDLSWFRQRHRAGSRPRRARPVQVDQSGRASSRGPSRTTGAAGRAQARREAKGRAARYAVARSHRRGSRVRRRRRRRRLRRHPRVLPLARAQEVQGARPGLPQPLSRLPDVPGLRRRALRRRRATCAGRRRDHRSRVGDDRSRGAAVRRHPRAEREEAAIADKVLREIRRGSGS